MTNLSETELEILNGHLLGDGCLQIHKRCKNAVFSLQRVATDLEYLKWSKSNLINIFKDTTIKYKSTQDKRTGKTYYSVCLRTKTCSELTNLYNKWYKNKLKRVPEDIKLTPITLAVWFADDGCVSKDSVNSLGVKLSTDGFIKDDVEHLASLLKEYCPYVYKSEKHKEQYNIRIFSEYAKKFYRDIDDVFPSLERKSSVWRSEKYDIYNKVRPEPCFKCGESKNIYFNGNTGNKQKFYCNNCKINYYSLESYDKKPRFLSYLEWEMLKPGFYIKHEKQCTQCMVLLPATDKYFNYCYSRDKIKKYFKNKCKKCDCKN